MVSTVSFGLAREARVRASIALLPFSTSLLLRHHAPFPSGRDKMMQVLRRMTRKGMVRRFRHGGEYLYHVGPKTSQWYHQHLVTRFYYDIFYSLKPGQKILLYHPEYDYGHGRADALYMIRLGPDRGIKFFLEMDDGTNKWDKTEKYEAYFRSMSWTAESWATVNGKTSFPLIVVVADRPIPGSKVVGVKVLKPGQEVLPALYGKRDLPESAEYYLTRR